MIFQVKERFSNDIKELENELKTLRLHMTSSSHSIDPDLVGDPGLNFKDQFQQFPSLQGNNTSDEEMDSDPLPNDMDKKSFKANGRAHKLKNKAKKTTGNPGILRKSKSNLNLDQSEVDSVYDSVHAPIGD